MTATVEQHYETLLADVYGWMVGDFDAKVAADRALFEALGVVPEGARRAVDLGCGPGYQSIALARLGFEVTAIDTSRKLLDTLAARASGLPITPLLGDIADLATSVAPGAGVIACMGDTLTHLPDRDAVIRLLADSAEVLAPDGKLVLGWRDLTPELTGTDRFIPVRSDRDRIMTCFLEYEPDTVVVHDIVHDRAGDGWRMTASSYRKLRLALDWVRERMTEAGFAVARAEPIGRMSVVLGLRQ